MSPSNNVNITLTATDKTGLAMASAKRNLTMLSKSGADVARTFAGMFGATLGLAAFAVLANRAIEFGSAITDAATATNTGIEALQALQFAAREAGATNEQMANALVRAQKSAQDAANGLSTMTRAFDALGLNVNDFIKLPTERKMEAIGKAMAASKNKAAAYGAALDILGTRNAPKLNEVLQRLGAEGFDALATSAQNAGQIMSEQVAKDLDAAADSIAKLDTKVTILAGNTIKWWMDLAAGKNPIEEQANAAANALKDKLNPEMRKAVELSLTIQKLRAAGATAYAGQLQTEYDLLVRNMAAQRDAAGGGFDESGDPSKLLAAEKDLNNERRTSQQRLQILQHEITQLTAEVKAMYVAGDVQSQKYYNTLESKTRKQIALEKELAGVRQDALDILDGMSKAGNTSLDDVFAIMDKADGGGAAQRSHDKLTLDVLNKNEMMLHSMQRTSDGMADAFVAFAMTGEASFGDMAKSILADIARMIIQMQVLNPLLNGIFGGGFGAAGGGAGAGAVAPTPHAMGGPVFPGRTYLVGEKGPELLTSKSVGSIVPNDKIGGGDTISVSISINTIDSASFSGRLNEHKRQITAAVDEALNKRGRRGISQ